jgi:hypothetical protein
MSNKHFSSPSISHSGPTRGEADEQRPSGLARASDTVPSFLTPITLKIWDRTFEPSHPLMASLNKFARPARDSAIA